MTCNSIAGIGWNFNERGQGVLPQNGDLEETSSTIIYFRVLRITMKDLCSKGTASPKDHKLGDQNSRTFNPEGITPKKFTF